MTIMKRLFGKPLPLLALASLSVLVVIPCFSADAPVERSRHVLVIVVDGAMPAVVKSARQNTASLSSYNSILTGVWADKHGVTSHRRQRPNHDKYPCFFKRLKEHKAGAYCSSIVNWQPINDRMVPEADHKAKGANDAEVVELAAKHLQEADPDVLFIQLDEVDGAGHGNGYSADSPKYVEAIEKADKYVGDLVAAVKKRKNYANEDWLIIVLSDHGGKGTSHGGDSPEERTVFMIVSGEQAKKAEVSPGPGIVAVTPTALHYLGVQIKPEWGLEAEPFGLKDYEPAPKTKPGNAAGE